MNFISIIIPLYNKEAYIKNTINKVLLQTYQNFELIIVNDGSKDNGPQIAESFSDPRIRLINKENGGVSSARNVGIKEAKYDYIAFLDADDEWLPNHLEEIHKLIVDYGSEANVFVTNFARKYPDGRIIPNRKEDELKQGIITNYFKEALKKAVIHTSCVCVSKNALDIVNGFDERFSNGEDIDLWVRLARKYKISYSPIVTEHYLQDAHNNSKIIKDYSKVAAMHIRLMKCVNRYDFYFNLKRVIKVRIRKFIK